MITLEELQTAKKVLKYWVETTDPKIPFSFRQWIESEIESKSGTWECIEDLHFSYAIFDKGETFSSIDLYNHETDPTKFPFHFKKVQP